MSFASPNDTGLPSAIPVLARSMPRRGFLAAAPAALVAATLPALAAGADPDTALLALRLPWLESLAAFDAALVAKGKIDEQVFARTESYPDYKTWDGSIADYTAICESITAARKAIHAELDEGEADRLEDLTSDALSAIIEQIESRPARTLAGIAFKVEVSEEEGHGRPELIDSIMADIKALAAGGSDA